MIHTMNNNISASERKPEFSKKLFWIIGFIFFIVLFPACQTDKTAYEKSTVFFSIEKLVVLPFKDMSRTYGENADVRCPLCGNVFKTGNVLKEADIILTEHFFSLLKKYTDFKLVSVDKAYGAMSGLPQEIKPTLSERELFVKTGRALEADAVAAGYIYRFKQRIGTSYSVEEPASVAFGIHIISTKNGRILWSGRFDETQQSLNENLLKLGSFLERKASWITAEEMAFSGLEDLLKKIYRP